ncbi:MAG: GTPase HflX [Bacteroides sp.]|nr:GTPase HflX [Bacteroides sp.]MCM1550988.1 GTPase HflX [Clostridium sp.]
MTGLYENKETQEQVILVAASVSDEVSVYASLDELEELAKTAGAAVAGRFVQNRQAVDTATYIGSGKVEELRELVMTYQATGIICDDELTPSQMNNLERELNIKIMDRTMIILDIFAARASTREGQLQVELAQLRYRSSHLIGMGRILSRQGGGIGTRGPGEKKLETDRRMIRQRISRLKEELNQVKINRSTQRKRRVEQGIPVICIVGYTNAGKSTLLNTLTDSEVLSEDKLFATLDPTTRSLELPDGQQVLLTDTVGFIRKLPHHLIQAFRATLEEAKYSDYILHVVDASNPQMDIQMHTVYETLRELGVEGKPVLTAFNKTDKEGVPEILKDFKADEMYRISARTGQGLEEMLAGIGRRIRESRVYLEHLYPYQEAAKIARVRKNGQIIEEAYQEDGILIRAFVDKRGNYV